MVIISGHGNTVKQPHKEHNASVDGGLITIAENKKS